jgi:hypothetical protein
MNGAHGMERDALKLETLAAFRHVQKPSAGQIVTHECLECDELKNDLHPYDSESVPHRVLDKHLWDLPLLSDDAKQYYLPAWIVRSIDDPQSDYTEALLFALDSDHRWFPTTPYTERQWRALEAYLDYLEANVDELTRDDIVKARRRLTGEP